MSELVNGGAGKRLLLLGNEAIVRGALEAGVSLAATYPGTPASEIGDRFYEISRQTELIFSIRLTKKWRWKWPPGPRRRACGLWPP